MSSPYPAPSFPNEIFSIIIEDISNDRSSLRNAALVSNNFAAMAQRHIFQNAFLMWDNPAIKHIRGEGSSIVFNIEPFLKTPRILRFVQHLYVSGRHHYFDDTEKAGSILTHMTALNALTIYSPTLCHIQAMVLSSLPSRLRVLHIGGFSAPELKLFRQMLQSLQVLEVLAMTGISCNVEECTTLVLPRTLRAAFFKLIQTNLLERLGMDMEMCHAGRYCGPPPSLRTVVLRRIAPNDCSRFWRALGNDTQIVFDNDVFFHAPRTISTKGFNAVKLVWTWDQDAMSVMNLHHCLSTLPESVRDLTIDINPQRPRLMMDNRAFRADTVDAWDRLDETLTEMYKNGTLGRLCFRCTDREGFFGFDTLKAPNEDTKSYMEDRSVLIVIENNLPRSKSISGFLWMDYETKVFISTV
ncbi:hypothetical protein D9757_003613 [Collybiopsis confluens]|uniref:Uncharacterized protein n=1 Tax=Collybiopsis confluens TaxID=2823264 RepID=A0A8H5HVB9_9AGAR|nr:hypothetical protein D9757_003613 [Collybiopsis confluens]